MQKLLYIVIIALCFSCKTKSLSVEKTVDQEQLKYSKKFDSLVQVYAKLQQELIKKNSSFSSSFVLKSIPVMDSLGNLKPLNYKHYINGELAEEIYLEGGELTQETEHKATEATEIKNEVKSENVRIESDVGINSASKKANKSKAKEVEVKGFQFGFYLWFLLLIIVLIVLYWIQKRLKLPDKIKELFGNKGG